MFPGQGSQYNGMFKEHFSEFIEFNKTIIYIQVKISIYKL